MLGAGVLNMGDVSLNSLRRERQSTEAMGRPVWVASLTQDGIEGENYKAAIRAAIKQMTYALPFTPDIFCLPEVFHVAQLKGGRPSLEESAEDGSGILTAPFQAFARQHACYIICPVYTVENGKYFNAAIVIDRKGEITGSYRKTRLTINELKKGLSPGPADPPVFKTDFGTIGIQLCHDIEWAEGWEQLGKKGAEIVFWPSAFAGGKKVNTRAWTNQYCVVSSTRKDTTKICDMTGQDLVVSGNWSRWGVCASVNLEKAFLHSYPDSYKFPEIQKKYGRKVNCYSLHEEEISIIESLSPGLKVKSILKEFGLMTYRELINKTEELQIKATF